MKNEANSAPIEIDPKAIGRARAGSWSWRDGVICITDSYASSPLFNNGHAGIMGASRCIQQLKLTLMMEYNLKAVTGLLVLVAKYGKLA